MSAAALLVGCKCNIADLNAGRGYPDFSTAEIIHTAITEGEPISPFEAAQLGGFPDSDQ